MNAERIFSYFFSLNYFIISARLIEKGITTLAQPRVRELSIAFLMIITSKLCAFFFTCFCNEIINAAKAAKTFTEKTINKS